MYKIVFIKKKWFSCLEDNWVDFFKDFVVFFACGYKTHEHWCIHMSEISQVPDNLRPCNVDCQHYQPLPNWVQPDEISLDLEIKARVIRPDKFVSLCWIQGCLQACLYLIWCIDDHPPPIFLQYQKCIIQIPFTNFQILPLFHLSWCVKITYPAFLIKTLCPCQTLKEPPVFTFIGFHWPYSHNWCISVMD